MSSCYNTTFMNKYESTIFYFCDGNGTWERKTRLLGSDLRGITHRKAQFQDADTDGEDEDSLDST